MVIIVNICVIIICMITHTTVNNNNEVVLIVNCVCERERRVDVNLSHENVVAEEGKTS